MAWPRRSSRRSTRPARPGSRRSSRTPDSERSSGSWSAPRAWRRAASRQRWLGRRGDHQPAARRSDRRQPKPTWPRPAEPRRCRARTRRRRRLRQRADAGGRPGRTDRRFQRSAGCAVASTLGQPSVVGPAGRCARSRRRAVAGEPERLQLGRRTRRRNGAQRLRSDPLGTAASASSPSGWSSRRPSTSRPRTGCRSSRPSSPTGSAAAAAALRRLGPGGAAVRPAPTSAARPRRSS